MLGEAFREEVAANGGHLPRLGLKTLARLATRFYLKRKLLHGKQKLGGLLHPFGMKVGPCCCPCQLLYCCSCTIAIAQAV